MKDRFVRITSENVEEIHNDSERLFASACLTNGAKVFWQIPLGRKVIDFLVIRPGEKRGVLVEVTRVSREKANAIPQKREQKDAMRDSGREWILFCRDDLSRLQKLP